MRQDAIEMGTHGCGSQSMCPCYSADSEDEAETFQWQYR